MSGSINIVDDNGIITRTVKTSDLNAQVHKKHLQVANSGSQTQTQNQTQSMAQTASPSMVIEENQPNSQSGCFNSFSLNICWLILMCVFCFSMGILVRGIGFFSQSSKLSAPQKIVTSTWNKCASDTNSRTGIFSAWNIRFPTLADPKWMLVNDICIDNHGVVEKGDGSFMKKTEKDFVKRFEFSGVKNDNSIVIIHNLGDKMVIQGIYVVDGTVIQSESWDIMLGQTTQQTESTVTGNDSQYSIPTSKLMEESKDSNETSTQRKLIDNVGSIQPQTELKTKALY